MGIRKFTAILAAAVAAQICGAQPSGEEPPRKFDGVWITSAEFENLAPINVFRRQLDYARAKQVDKLSRRIQNRHILFRKEFSLDAVPKSAEILFSADDYAKVYVNGKFAAQGPAAGYPFHYLYQKADISKLLKKGRNVIAVHSYYQGLINRVWVGGDFRHGFICDVLADGKTLLKTDSTWRQAEHRAYSSAGIAGYDTQFLERYDAAFAEVGFERPDFDDSYWQPARVKKNTDYKLFASPLKPLVFEDVKPAKIERRGDTIFVDFGAMYVGYFAFEASGKKGDELQMRFGQELNADSTVRYKLRANCNYVEYFRLSGAKKDALNQFDFKSFRYAEIVLPKDSKAKVDESSIKLVARHMPFKLAAKCRYPNDPTVKKIWDLCVRSIAVGVQEQIQDCMEREKGYYLGDGCYTMLTWCLLTGDFAPMRKMVDDFLRTSFINEGLVTCANCSFMQEIAEYPLMMFTLLPVLEARDADREFVKSRLPQFRKILQYYAKTYGTADGLLANLDKWCVVEWPAPWRDGYDVDIREGRVCKTKHNVINAWYVGAIRQFNRVARKLGESEFAGEKELTKAFLAAFYDADKKLFKDSETSAHISFPANVYPWFLGLCPDEQTRRNIVEMVRQKRMSKSLLFVTFPLMASLRRDGEEALLYELLTDKNAWLKMLDEGATTTFEGWSKDAKWNTSLFHLTLSYGAVFMTDWDVSIMCK